LPSSYPVFPRSLLLAFFAALCARPGLAHDHGHEEIDPNVPIDSILWIHISIQVLVWGFLWPIGMVLGILLAISMHVGGEWLRRKGKSQEWFDSWVIMLWGIVNTFTEHRGSHWSHKDMQHTTLGVLC